MWVSALVLTAARQVAFWYIPAGTPYEVDLPDQPEEGLLFCLLWLLPLFLTICGIHSSPECLSRSLAEMSPIWRDQFCQISPFWKRPEGARVKNSLSPADMRERTPVLLLANRACELSVWKTHSWPQSSPMSSRDDDHKHLLTWTIISLCVKLLARTSST